MSIQKRLYRQIAVFACSLFAVMSFTPSYVSFGNYSESTSEVYSEGMVISDDGYFTKLIPETDDADLSVMSDGLTHIIESGETLSAIAAQYNLKVETIMWVNGIYNPNSLKVGQAIIIPPMDGVYHTVAQGDTLSSIATKYSVESDLIAKQNDFSSESVLSIGEELFIPGAKGVVPEAPAPQIASATASRNTVSRTGTASRSYVANPSLPTSEAAPVAGKSMIWPTSGKVTQGYKAGHPALDVAKYPGGAIWAACSGTVVKASSGTYAGGYGNHVILDCGNGIKTLYAHMEYLSVKAGDAVSQGQVLGKMGNTGRVYGRTGIHLHFEVWKNGVKQSPWGYLQ